MAEAQPQDAAIPALRAAGLWNDDDNSRSILKAIFTPALWKGGENSYELERNFRIERNHRFMAGLGLNQGGPQLGAKRPAIRLAAPRKKKVRPEGWTPRRSPRTTGEVSYSGSRVDRSLEEDEREVRDEDYDYESEDDDERLERWHRRARADIAMIDAEDRALLADPNWLEGFKRWLKTGDESTKPASESNINRCIPKVELLAAGAGIDYVHWGSHTFKAGVKVDMTSDLFQIWYDGKEHENRYGKDKGNGWQVNHPVKKLLLYQHHLWRQHLANTAEAEDAEEEDVEEDVEEEASAEEASEEGSVEAAAGIPPGAPADPLAPAIVTPRKAKKAAAAPAKRSPRAPAPRAAYDPKAEAAKPQWGSQTAVVAASPPKAGLVGAKLRKRFPGFGVFTGEVVGPDALLKGKYLVEWSDGDETSETVATIKKFLV